MKRKIFVLFPFPALLSLSLGLALAEPAKNYDIREEMVPMRDGVKLFTRIVTPRVGHDPRPILLERTPYNASESLGGHPSTRLAVALGNKFVGNDTIYVFQDIRGRFHSEGDVALYRVPRGRFNSSETDETTDAWDTIDWLVKNVPGSNGRVGVWGTSYPGWLTLAAMRDPHPALAAAVPFNPVVDVWKADDWFHWGAFRATYAFDYIYEMETKRGEAVSYPHEVQDIYTWMLAKGAAGTGLGSMTRRPLRDVEENHGEPELRSVLERRRRRSMVRFPAAARAHSPRAGILGPGRYLRIASGLRRDRKARPGKRSQLLRRGALVPRPALRRWQPARRAELRPGHLETLSRRRPHPFLEAVSQR